MDDIAVYGIAALVGVVAGLVLAVVRGVFVLLSKRWYRHNAVVAVANLHKRRRPVAKSKFQKWKDENETLQSNGKVETTLEQQIELASRLWNEAAGNADTTVSTVAQTQEILKALQKTQVDDKESIVSWKGFHVGWFLDVFCQTPYMEKLLEFGCELWFVRKVCVIEIIRRAHCAMNKDTTDVPVLSGPFVNFMDTVVSGLGLEGDTDNIVKTPTTFISYTGGKTMQETLDTLRQLDPNEIVWMDVFCVNQFAWTGKSRSPEMKLFKDSFLGDLETQIQTINNTVLVVADWENVMATLGQIWVLWEIFCTAEGRSGLNVVLPPAQAHDFVQNCLESDKNFDGIMRSLASIDANRARAEEYADQQAIFERMQEVGLANVNNAASGAVRGWLYQQGQEYLKERRESKDGPSELLLASLARLLQEQGKLGEAEPLFLEALEKHQKVLGRDHPHTLASLNNLAALLHAMGRLDEAELLFREALEKHQKVLGRNHQNTLTFLDNLAGLLQTQGRLDEAKPLYREALEQRQKVLGCDHPSALISLNNLALLLKDQGKLDEAEPLFREALEQHQKVLGRDHPSTLTSLNDLALLLHDQGKSDEAEPMFRKILEKRQKVLGRDHPSTLSTLGSLASLLQAHNKLDEAEPLCREALEECQKALGCDHPDTLICINNLAALLQAKGRLDEAEPLFREALEKSQKALGRNHRITLASLNNLAGLLRARGELGEAEPLYREALEKSQKLLGRDHPDTLTSLNDLATLLQDQGGSVEAELLFREALERRRKVLGRDHPNTLISLNNLATLLQDQGRLGEAEPLFRETLAKSERLLGHDHPSTFVFLNNLAKLLQDRGQLDEAEPLYRDALEKRQKALGRDHPDTLGSLNNLAGLLQAQGKPEEAEPLIREALAKSEKLLGRNHPNTLISMFNLALLLHQRGGSACLDKSKALLLECKTTSLAKLGADHPFTTDVQKHWGRLFGSPLP